MEIDHVVIKKMEPSHIEKVSFLEKAIFSQPWSNQGFLEALSRKDTIFLIAEAEGEVIGYGGMYCAADEGEITNVAIEEKFRKNGIGRKLLKELLEESEKEGIRQVFLEVRVSNESALCLYQSMGFEIAGVRKNFYRYPKEDAYVMNRNRNYSVPS